MAFVSNMNDEDEKNQSQGAVAPGGASNTIQTGPQGGIGSVGGATPGASNAATGGQFATLQNYVNANQGAAQPLANKITSDIGNQYNTLQGQNQQTLSGIQGQVDKGYTKQNQDILNQEASNPVSFASDPNNISAFQGQLTDSYKGPGSAEGTSDYQNQLAKVNQAISTGQANTGTDAGRQNLLKSYETKPTAGVTGLNSAILAQNPTAQGQISNAYKPFSNLVSDLSTGAGGINTNIGQAQTEAGAASSAANKQISDQISGLNKSVNDTAANDIKAQNDRNTQLQDYQAKWNPLSTDINSINEALKNNPLIGGGAAYTNPFTSILNQSVSNNVYTPQNVATQDQYAQAGAFNSLLSGLNTGLEAPILSQDTANQAGTAQAPAAFAPNTPSYNDIYNGVNNEFHQGTISGNPQWLQQWKQVEPVSDEYYRELAAMFPGSH